MRYFSPPSVAETHRLPGDPLWRFNLNYVGQTLLKQGGFYHLVREVSPQDWAADVIYLGGHVYEIDDAEVVDLTDAGYGQWIGDEVTGYGTGNYGAGLYGRPHTD